MRNLLYIAAILIVGCSKPTMDDAFIAPPIDVTTPTDNGNNTNTATDTSVTATTTAQTEVRTDYNGGYIIRTEEADTKGNITYYYEAYPDANHRLVAFTQGGNITYQEGTLQGELTDFVFAEITTFEYNGRTFEIESTLVQHRAVYEAQWDAAKADMNGTDGGDYDDRFVILESRGYFFGALAQEDYTIYQSSAFERGTILHEIGHVWSLRNGSPVNWDEWSVLMQNYHVSAYGATALTEYFAEAFAHHFLVKAGDPYHSIPDEVREKLESYGL